MGLGENAVALDILLNAVDNTKQGVEGATGRLGKLGEMLGFVFKAATIATGAAVAMGGKFVDEFTSAAGAAHEMSVKFGTTIEQSSRWIGAGKQIGVANETIMTGFQMLSRTMNNLDQQFLLTGKLTAAQTQVFKELGIKIMDTHGNLRPLNDVMLEIAARFKSMPDGAEKAGLAMKLFGRSGTDMIPMLNQGADGIRALMKNADALGLTMTEKDVAATKAWHRELATLKLTAEGAGISIGRVLMPGAIELFKWIDAKVAPAITTAATWLGQYGIPWLTAFVEQLVRMGEKAWPAVTQGAKDFWKSLSPLVPPLKDLGTSLVTITPALLQTSNIMQAASSVMSGWPAIVQILVVAIKSLNPVILFLGQNANLIVPAILGIIAAQKLWAAFNFAKDIYIMGMAYRSLAAEEGIAAAASALLGISMGPITITLLALAAVVALVALAWNNNWGDIQGKTKVAVALIGAAIAIIGPLLMNYIIKPMIVVGTVVGQIFGGIFKSISDVLGWISNLFKQDSGGIHHNALELFGKVAAGIIGIFTNLHIPLPHFEISGWHSLKIGPADVLPIPELAVKWFGQGGNFIANRPTLIGVGESGPEAVSIRPLGGGAGGAGGILVQFLGPVNFDSQDRIRQFGLELDRQRRLGGGKAVLA